MMLPFHFLFSSPCNAHSAVPVFQDDNIFVEFYGQSLWQRLPIMELRCWPETLHERRRIDSGMVSATKNKGRPIQ